MSTLSTGILGYGKKEKIETESILCETILGP